MLGIVCCDAGGAEVVSSWLKKNKKTFLLSARGPAKKIFQNLFKNIKFQPLSNLLNNSNEIITGTGFTEFEINAIDLANKRNIKTIAILDHWVNYRERFYIKDTLILPNEIWVCDKFAFEEAIKVFDKNIIKKIRNPYIQRIKSEFFKFKNQSIKENKAKKILYVGSPVSINAKKKFNDELYFGYSEKDAINFFFKKIKETKYKKYIICFRPHPSEKLKNYSWVTGKYADNFKIIFSKNDSLIHDIFSSNLIVGCNSMALVISAIACNKTTINAIPFKSIKNNIPYKKVSLLR